MIWLIFWAEPSISLIADMAWATTWPPVSAPPLADTTTSRVSLAPSAVLRTVAVICSSAAAVSSSEAACCSVRRDRSSEATLISWLPEWMPPALPTITPMVCSSLAIEPLKSSRSFS